MKRIISGITLALLLIGMSSLALNILPVRATGTIYIRPDGSVDPQTAPIQQNGDIYTFASDIYDSNLEVLRSNVVIDGAGHKMEGTGNVNGIMVSSASGLKIKNIEIKGFRNGIAYSSNNSIIGNKMTSNLIGLNLLSGNTVIGNEIESNRDGIWVQPPCTDNIIAGNNISLNNGCGIDLLAHSSQNTICNNSIVANGVGISLLNNTGNVISNNYIAENTYGITSGLNSIGNRIYHNNIVGNVHQSYVSQPQPENTWDDGYPAGGNYWSDYAGTDMHSGPYQNDTGSDGIGDAQYSIDAHNRDNYPLMHPWDSFPVHNIGTGLGYSAIQEAVDANETLDRHTIFVEAGTYLEHLVLNKTLALIGEDKTTTIVDGGGTEPYHIVDVQAHSVVISGFTLRNACSAGGCIWVDGYVNCRISDNIMVSNDLGDGIRIRHSHDNIIEGNFVANSTAAAVGLDWTYNSTVVNNTILNSSVGVRVDNPSYNNTFSGNTIMSNGYGFLMALYNSRFFHNNLINNSVQASFLGSYSGNSWDNGYPSGGNHWSDYSGIDGNGDGIGDSQYIIDGNNQDNYPLMNPWTPPRIAVANLTVSKTIVGEGLPLPINLTVENQGNKIDAFNISVYANTTLVKSQIMFLTSGNSATLTFEWNTSGFAKGNYTVSAYAWPISEEASTGDNNCTDGVVLVTVLGDVTGDLWVDMQDVSVTIDAFMAYPGDQRWNSNCDINNDLNIDMLDISIVIDRFMQT